MWCLNNSGDHSEGLTLTNSALNGSIYGFDGVNCISVNISNSVIDQAGTAAIRANNCAPLMVNNCWLYGTISAPQVVLITAHGGGTQQGISFTGNYIWTNSTTGIGISIVGGNSGIVISGGTIICGSSSGYCVYGLGTNTTVDGVYFVNAGSNASCAFDTSATNYVSMSCTGATTVSFNSGPFMDTRTGQIDFAFSNNISSFTNITGCLVSSATLFAADVEFLVRRNTATNEVLVRAKLQLGYSTLNSAWEILDFQEFGGASGITWSITSVGQLQYKSTNLSGSGYVDTSRFKIIGFPKS